MGCAFSNRKCGQGVKKPIIFIVQKTPEKARKTFCFGAS